MIVNPLLYQAMKKFALLTLLILAGIFMPIQGQNLLYTFHFDTVNDSPGKGYIKIYDNRTIEYYGSGKDSFHCKFTFVSANLLADTFFSLYSASGQEQSKQKPHVIFIGGNYALYSEVISNDTITHALKHSNEHANDNPYTSLLDSYRNRTGAFINFRSLSDLELPLSIEGWIIPHTVDIPGNESEKAYPVRTKTGKYVNETNLKDYEVWTDANWLTIRTQTETAFLLKWESNPTGATRSANVYVKAGDKTTQMTVRQAALKASIEQVWVEHNKRQGLVKGMKIHVRFQTYGVRGLPGNCAAYFSFANGTRLMDYNGAYRSVDGQVCCGGSFISNYDSCIFNDYVLFMPYSELHITGKADCKFLVQVTVGGQYISSQEVFFNVY